MNYVKVVNKAEILIYSTLISIMSGINRYKDLATDIKQTRDVDIGARSDRTSVISAISGRSFSMTWEAIQQALISLLLWTSLGLAAGFLIGMLKHG